MGKVGCEEEEASRHDGPDIIFEGGCEIAEHCRSDGDSCGMTGGRVVVAVGWVAVTMIEVPRLCGSEVVPPWLNLILEDL